MPGVDREGIAIVAFGLVRTAETPQEVAEVRAKGRTRRLELDALDQQALAAGGITRVFADETQKMSGGSVVRPTV
jgi:hypothetical protein